MSSFKLALVFTLLFSAGYIAGSPSRNALYRSALLLLDRIWQTGLLKSIIIGVGILSTGFALLLVVGERAAALEERRGAHRPEQSISAQEYLRRRGSF